MALRKLEADLSPISKLGKNPGVDDGLTTEQLKAKFDEAANIIKDYLNNYLILEIEKTVDVESLLSGILDVNLSKKDKAANAKATGDAIRDLRAFFEKVVHSGDYVLESDGCFAAEAHDNATVIVSGGEGVIQGNLFSLNMGTSEGVRLKDGTYGLRRSDLIVVRCTKDENNILSYSLVGLTGTTTSGETVDPAYAQSDINGDGTLHEFPLYRVTFDGYSITSLTPLFKVQKDMATDLLEYQQSSVTNAVAAILTADGWSEAAPYTQSIQVNGLSDKVLAQAYPDIPDDAAEEAALAEETPKVTSCKRSGNTMTFRCREEKPSLDIPIIVEVYV